MLAHVRGGARLTEVEQEKQILRTPWKPVRAMWGSPPDHPPAEQWPRNGCGDGVHRSFAHWKRKYPENR